MGKVIQGVLIAVIVLGSSYLVYSLVIQTPFVIPKSNLPGNNINNIPEGWTKYDKDNITFYHPSSFRVVENVQQPEGVATANLYFDDETSTVSLRVYKDNSALFRYSVNSPDYCRFNGETWEWYSNIFDTYEGHTKCDEIEKTSIAGNTSYSVTGGGLGLDEYIVDIVVDGVHFIFSDVRYVDPLKSTNVDEELIRSLNLLTTRFAEIN